MSDFPQMYERSKLDEMYAQLGLPDDTVKLLQDYFSAFGNFYNIISLGDAYGIIRRHNGDLISAEDFIAFSEVVRHDEGNYYYILGRDELYENAPAAEAIDREIVHESLVDVDFEYYYDLSDSQKGKPLYIPEKNELLKFTDDFYYEQNPQTEALFDFFRNKMGMDNECAEDMTCECVFCILSSIFPKENPINEVIQDFVRLKIKFTNFQFDEFIRLTCDLNNNIRHRCNRGFTPNELADRLGINERKTISAISASGSGRKFKFSEIGLIDVKRSGLRRDGKVGRNDPCPCGSGKKYKKCCGR